MAEVPPFIAPAVTTGSLDVTLAPTSAVTQGSTQLVTFGVPFPRGSMALADVERVRVLSGGSEIPAYVEALTPWRHPTTPALDNQHVLALQEAVRATDDYRADLYPPGTTPDTAVGAHRLKSPAPGAYIGANDIMYSYNESLAYALWLTGDEQMKEPIKWVAKGQEDATDDAYRWSPTAGYTERHVAFRILSHLVAWEVFGAQPYKPGGGTYLERFTTGVENLIDHQNGAGGAVPAQRVDGALWKLGSQQGDGPPDSYVASAWLSPIVVDVMVRAYADTDRADVGAFIRRMGTFLMAGTKRGADLEYDSAATTRSVDYLTLIDGSTYAPDGVTGEHALEVAAALGWAYYFSRVAGDPSPDLRAAAQELYDTYDWSVNYWTRPAANSSGLTAYRITPWRKYAWQYRVSNSFSWCMTP